MLAGGKGGLFGGGKGGNNSQQSPKYTQMQLQTSSYGMGIPIVYGATRVGWNLAWYGNFKAHKQSSGKGGFTGGKGKSGSSYTYTADILGTICEGPVRLVASLWNSQTHMAGTSGFTVSLGAVAQPPWSNLSSHFPAQAVGYSGFCWAAQQNMDLGSSGGMPNFNWEVLGFKSFSTPSTYGGNGCAVGGDADPSIIIPDLLTNPQYGAGFPTTRIGQVNRNVLPFTVPNAAPYQITVTDAIHFLRNLDVAAAGTPLTCVATTPQPGQYSFNASTGVYSFNAAQAGALVTIAYVTLTPLTNYQNWCLASGLWVSPNYSEQAQANSYLDDLAVATFSEFVWSSGVLQVIPRGSQNVTGHGHSYTAPNTALFALGVDDFMAGNASNASDPVMVTRKRPADQINNIKYEVLDRANQYAPAIVEVLDKHLADRYGRRAEATRTMHIFCDVGSANISANLRLQDQYLRNMYAFTLDERYCVLDPMDIVTLTDPAYPNLTNIAVRLLEITENDDGSVDCIAEEFPGTVGLVPAYSLNVGSGYTQQFDVDPGSVAAPAIFDVPVQLSQVQGLETWIGFTSQPDLATGLANPNWGGAELWWSTDGVNYFQQGDAIPGGSRMGFSTNLLFPSPDPDTTHTLSVNLEQSLGSLQSGTQADADNGVTLCFLDGEYLSYENAALTSQYNYNLTYLRRGLWGSAISQHSPGSIFVRLDNNVFRVPYTQADIGTTVYIKLLSFNIYGQGMQTLAEATAYTHVLGGPPTLYAPANLTVTPALKSMSLTWDNPPNVGVQAVEIWRSFNANFASALHIDDAAAYATTYVDQNNIISGTPYWYWVRCRDIAGNEGPYDPASSGAGATATALTANTPDITPSAVTAPAQTLSATSIIPTVETLLMQQTVNVDANASGVYLDFSDYINRPGNTSPTLTYNLYRYPGLNPQFGTLLGQAKFGSSGCPLFFGVAITYSDTNAAILGQTVTYKVTYAANGSNGCQSNSPGLNVIEAKR